MEYFTYKRFKGRGIDGGINLPRGTLVQERDGFLYAANGQKICAATSENGWEHFCPNNVHAKYRLSLLTELYRYFQRNNCAGELTPDVWPGENRYWKNLLRTAPTQKLEALYTEKIGGRKCTKS